MNAKLVHVVTSVQRGHLLQLYVLRELLVCKVQVLVPYVLVVISVLLERPNPKNAQPELMLKVDQLSVTFVKQAITVL